MRQMYMLRLCLVYADVHCHHGRSDHAHGKDDVNMLRLSVSFDRVGMVKRVPPAVGLPSCSIALSPLTQNATKLSVEVDKGVFENFMTENIPHIGHALYTGHAAVTTLDNFPYLVCSLPAVPFSLFSGHPQRAHFRYSSRSKRCGSTDVNVCGNISPDGWSRPISAAHGVLAACSE